MAKSNTTVNIKIKVGKNHRVISLFELLDEMNLLKLRNNHFDSVKVNGNTEPSFAMYVYEDDVVELSIETT